MNNRPKVRGHGKYYEEAEFRHYKIKKNTRKRRTDFAPEKDMQTFDIDAATSK